MKNLLPILVLGILTFIGCQSETKNTSSNDASTAAASVPVSKTSPAPVAAAPKAALTEAKQMTDEAPTVPAKYTTATKSVENMEAKSASTAAKTTQIKEAIMDKKDDMTKVVAEKGNVAAKMAAEKEKMAAKVAEAKAEEMRKVEEKAQKLKEMAANKAETAKNNVKEKVAEVTGIPGASAVGGVKEIKKVEEIKEVKEIMAFSHQGFDDLLRKHVSSSGKVNYAGLKKDQVKLKAYLKQLEGQAVEGSWSKNKKLAYWINAYNAYTIDLIIRNYPVKSIKDLEGGKPWDKKFIGLNGKTLSLNNIENDIIRPTFKDGRIHFAVNCAAKSCPPLLNKAWTEGNLQGELDKRTRAFINSSSYNTISSGSAKVSKIFEWYAVDFGNLNDYLAKYSKAGVTGSTTISYIDYDWSLNN